MNRVAEQLTGWTAGEALGRGFSEVFVVVNELTRAPVANPIERVLREGVVVGLANHTALIARDGTERPIADSAAPIREGAGALLGTVLVFRDMTQERAIERKLRSAHERLEQRVAERTAELLTANLDLKREIAERQRATAALKRSEEQFRQAQKMEAVGRLAGGIAHDFNNVLSVILSYSDLLARDLPEGDAVRADLQEIHKAGERAATLTRQLLAFSRQQVLAPRIVDLNEILAGMGKLLDRVIGEDIDLRTRTLPDLKRVKVDPGQIEQVIMNLVVNARDAMPQGGELTLETANVDLDAGYAAAHPGVSPGPHVMLVVSDTGSGMSEATQARAFEPFFTTKEQGKGTGLGLSTVFGIVEQSGGSLALQSAPGEGSTFRLYFPVASQAESPGLGQRCSVGAAGRGRDDSARRGRGAGSKPGAHHPEQERLPGARGPGWRGGPAALRALLGPDSPDPHRRDHAQDRGPRAGRTPLAAAASIQGALHVRLHRRHGRPPRRPEVGNGLLAEADHARCAGAQGA